MNTATTGVKMVVLSRNNQTIGNVLISKQITASDAIHPHKSPQKSNSGCRERKRARLTIAIISAVDLVVVAVAVVVLVVVGALVAVQTGGLDAVLAKFLAKFLPVVDAVDKQAVDGVVQELAVDVEERKNTLLKIAKSDHANASLGMTLFKSR